MFRVAFERWVAIENDASFTDLIAESFAAIGSAAAAAS